MNWNEEKLNQMLSEPSAALIEDVKKSRAISAFLAPVGRWGRLWLFWRQELASRRG